MPKETEINRDSKLCESEIRCWNKQFSSRRNRCDIQVIGRIGNYYSTGRVVSGGGIAPTIMENHGKILMVLVYEN